MSTPPTPERAKGGPLPGLLGRLAAGVYGLAIGRRNRAFDAGRGVATLPLPVVSVGNLSVGGTGKTPMVAHLCRVLLERRVRPCIAMRGYVRGKRGGAGSGSDEADLYRREFAESVDVVAQPDRAEGVRELLAAGGMPRAVILDDGFQHRQIRRDLDIVLIDASRDPFGDRLLPAGWLRETTASLGRASCVVVTHWELAQREELMELRRKVERATGGPPIAMTRHLWTALSEGGEAGERLLPLDWLLGKRVVGVCAIGNPRGFTDALAATVGSEAQTEFIVRPDHDPFDAATVDRILETARRVSAQAIVMTDKDWSKLRRVERSAWPCPVVRPVLSLGFVEGQREFERLVLAAVQRRPLR